MVFLSNTENVIHAKTYISFISIYNLPRLQTTDINRYFKRKLFPPPQKKKPEAYDI